MKEEAAGLYDHTDEPSEAEPTKETPPSPKIFCGEKKLLHMLEDTVQPSVTTEFANDKRAQREVEKYVADEETIDCYSSPLEWWARSHMRYHTLSQLAKKFLPCTSHLHTFRTII